MKTTEIVSIIIPTWNLPDFLIPCLESLLVNSVGSNLFKIYVVDNGTTAFVKDYLPKELLENIVLINAGKNLGWEGGLKLGLLKIPKDVEFVMFLNDDIQLPFASRFWLHKMLQWFKDPKVGAVGPTSNVVMGNQNIFRPNGFTSLNVELLIGFCVLLRKSALEKAGGVDDTLPGGDDFDLSIRMVDQGYKLIIDNSVFVFHHGFKSGEKLRGTANVNGGWNSFEMMQRVNTALIQKHGFARWQRLMVSLYQKRENVYDKSDKEGDVIRSLLPSVGKVYELGCGGQKTVSDSIGIDLVPKGEMIGTIAIKSVADIIADVSKELPFNDANIIIARHILEHMIDPIEVLRNWYKALKNFGTLIIAVPDEELGMTLVMNIEHRHAYTKKFLTSLFEFIGLKNIETFNTNNGISFVIKGVKHE